MELETGTGTKIGREAKSITDNSNDVVNPNQKDSTQDQTKTKQPTTQRLPSIPIRYCFGDGIPRGDVVLPWEVL